MAKATPISRLEPVFLRVSAKTVWSFLRVHAGDGTSGIGEVTLPGQEPAIANAMAHLDEAYRGFPADPATLSPLDEKNIAGNQPRVAAHCALDQAPWDLATERRGMPLHALLGRQRRTLVPLYANINRRITDGSPTGFAAKLTVYADLFVMVRKVIGVRDQAD